MTVGFTSVIRFLHDSDAKRMHEILYQVALAVIGHQLVILCTTSPFYRSANQIIECHPVGVTNGTRAEHERG